MAIAGQTLSLEQKLRRDLSGITDNQVRTLVRAWAKAWDDIAPDLDDLLTEMLSAGDVTRAQMLRSKRLTNTLAAIATSLETLAKDAGVTIAGDLRGIIDQAGAAQAELIASQLPSGQSLVGLDEWARVDPRQISAIVKRSTQQITARTLPLSSSATDAVRRELVRGIAAGTNPRATARRIVARTRGEFNGGLNRALTIARTESLDAHRAAAQLAQARHTDVLAGWTWLASIGPRTCPACWGMNGTVHSLSEPGPNGHQNCRCARVPTTKSWAELGFDGITEPPSAMVDADAAFAKLTPLQQQSILGRRGYRGFVQGKFPRSQWAKRQKNPGWRDSYVPRTPPKTPVPKAAPSSGPRPPRRPAMSTSVPPPPATPTTAPANGPSPPPMGRTLGTQAQQAYSKSSTLGSRPPNYSRPDTADHVPLFVPDAEDRTTALLQYFKVFEDLVKSRALGMEAGEAFSAAETTQMRTLVRQMTGNPRFGVGNGNYVLDDLRADIDGAAYRLLGRRADEESLGTVFKGIDLPGTFDLADPDEIQAAVDAVIVDDWWFTSATPEERIARAYLGNSGVPATEVLLVIENATGIRLDSMGRMASASEVLLSGGFDVERYDVLNGLLRIYGRWRR